MVLRLARLGQAWCLQCEEERKDLDMGLTCGEYREKEQPS